MTQRTVLHIDAYPNDPLPVERRIIEGAGMKLEVAHARTEDDVIAAAQDAEVCLDRAAPFSRRVFESLPNLKAVIRYGIGLDSIDLEAATDHGVIVANYPDFCVEEVSNHAITLLLALAKKLFLSDRIMRQGLWNKKYELMQPVGPIYGQTLGLIAFGKIARLVAQKAQAFKLNVIAFDPYGSPELAKQLGVELVSSLDELLRRSDYISVHTPLTKETRHMLGEAQFRAMKPTAFFINTSRGGAVDEPALIKALQDGWIAGAGLDVTEKEPAAPDNPLLAMDNVILTPHTAHYSAASRVRLQERIAEEAVRVLQGKWPLTLANPDVRCKLDLSSD